MKQNSIEWLYDQMSNLAAGYTTELNQQEILEKAKTMHEAEITETASIYFHERTGLTPEQYYKETFA